jgi:hypothetical protein
MCAVHLPDLVRLHEMGMIESRSDFPLVVKHRQNPFVVGDRFPQPFDDDELFEVERPADHREKDVAHAASPQHGKQVVFAEFRDDRSDVLHARATLVLRVPNLGRVVG